MDDWKKTQLEFEQRNETKALSEGKYFRVSSCTKYHGSRPMLHYRLSLREAREKRDQLLARAERRYDHAEPKPESSAGLLVLTVEIQIHEEGVWATLKDETRERELVPSS